jgi:predicted RecA/RadA family phage recombinase
MTTLAKDTPRDKELGDINELPVVASDILYEGAAVGENGSGYARPLVAGDPFKGFAERKVDNAAGAAGDKNVRVETKGIVKLPITSLAITDIGKDVYASDDDTFTLTEGANTRIGYVKRWDSTGYGYIEFEASRGSGQEAELTDNSGGTASDTIAAISDTATKNAVASLAAKLNHVLRSKGN